MKLGKVAACWCAALGMAGAQADTLFSEGFEDMAALTGAGWVFVNASAPAGLSWFQGNSGIFAAESGSAGSYAAANFNSTTAIEGAVDNWLISPEVTLGESSTVTFFTRAADAGFFDLLEVRFSAGSSAAVADFSTVLGSVGTAGAAAYPLGGWVSYSFNLPAATSGRVAFHYVVPNALDASYVGIDSVSVSAVPEPGALALFAAGLAAVQAARRRKAVTTANTKA